MFGKKFPTVSSGHWAGDPHPWFSSLEICSLCLKEFVDILRVVLGTSLTLGFGLGSDGCWKW